MRKIITPNKSCWQMLHDIIQARGLSKPHFCNLTGLDEVIGHFPDGYDTPCRPDFFSQGQWQLISIARAVAANPRILLLDEITANLDADTEKNVLAALDRAGNGRTVLSISHRLYESLNLNGQSSGRQIAIDRTL